MIVIAANTVDNTMTMMSLTVGSVLELPQGLATTIIIIIVKNLMLLCMPLFLNQR